MELNNEHKANTNCEAKIRCGVTAVQKDETSANVADALCADGASENVGASASVGASTSANESTDVGKSTPTPTDNLTAAGTPAPKNWLQIAAIIFSGQLFSILSSAAAGYALIWYLTLTGSATVLVLGMAAYMLPAAILAPFVGAIVDRHNRKHIMIGADIFIAAITLLMVGLVALGWASVPLVLTIIVIRSVGSIFHSTAFEATMPLLVPGKHLVRIGSLSMALIAGTNIFGPALGIWLYTALGLHMALLTDVIGALIACTALLFVTIPDVHLQKAEQTNVLREMGDGLRAVRHTAGMSQFFIISAVACVFFMPMSALFPLFTVEHFDISMFGEKGFAAAAVEASFGAGFLIGSIILGAWGGGKRLVRLIQIAVFVCGIITATCGLLPPGGYWWFFILSGLMAITGGFFNTPMTVIIQKNIAPERLGRVLTLMSTITSAAGLVGLGLAGAFGDIVSPAFVFVTSGLGMMITIGVSLTMPKLHRLDDVNFVEDVQSVSSGEEVQSASVADNARLASAADDMQLASAADDARLASAAKDAQGTNDGEGVRSSEQSVELWEGARSENA